MEKLNLTPELEQGLQDILERGGCVFPICSDSKIPLPLPGQKIGIPGGGGYKLATNDPRIIWNYFRGDPIPEDMPKIALKTLKTWRKTIQPNAAIALDMSDMIVIDADNLVELEDFQEQFGKFPSTYTVKSPRKNGGLHFYFKSKSDINYKHSPEGFPHIDVKHHGYVLIPGSVKRNESKEIIGCYSVVNSSPIVEIPDWLFKIIEKPKFEPHNINDSEWSNTNSLDLQAIRNYISKMEPAISGNGGHNTTLAVARVLVRGFALSEDDAFDILYNDYNPRCEPPWTEWELRHKIRSASKFTNVPLGYLLNPCFKDSYDIKPLWDNDNWENI